MCPRYALLSLTSRGLNQAFLSTCNRRMIMKKILTLHIGRAKTGSSAIQGALKASRTSLALEGFCYPMTGGKENDKHHPLLTHACHKNHPLIARACNKNYQATQGVDINSLKLEFEKETSGFNKIIVSSEGFQNIIEPKLFEYFFPRRLANSDGLFKAHYEIRTLCYLREVLSGARSAFSQRVQTTGIFCSFSQFLHHYASIDLHVFSKFWHGVSDTVEFASYCATKQLPKGVVSDFERRIGLSLESSSDILSRNPSISGNLLIFKLLINKLGLFDETHSPLLLDLATSEARFSGGFCIEKTVSEKLRNKYSEYNKCVAFLSGDCILEDYSHAPPLFDAKNWHRDLEMFLDKPEFSGFKDDSRIWGEDPGTWRIEE